MSFLLLVNSVLWVGVPWWLRGQSICLPWGRPGFDLWVGKIPWRRKWQPTPVFLPGESHGQRSLAGYSPRGRKESDTTEQLHTHTLKLWWELSVLPVGRWCEVQRWSLSCLGPMTVTRSPWVMRILLQRVGVLRAAINEPVWGVWV